MTKTGKKKSSIFLIVFPNSYIFSVKIKHPYLRMLYFCIYYFIMMLKKYIHYIGIIFILCSCNQHSSRPGTAEETGKRFIRNTLDGDFDQAETLLYKDSLNVQFYENYKSFMDKQSDSVKQKYKGSDFIINKFSQLNDSTAIIDFSNSYKNKPTEIKVVKRDGDWWVDLKYTMDTTSNN